MTSRLRAALVALVLLYGIALASFSLPAFPTALSSDHRWPYLSDKPLGEDGFYMLTIAWNAGRGQGFAYNGGELTTGVQPLSTIVDAAVAGAVQRSGGDKWIFARVMIVVGVLELLLFAAVMRRLTVAITRDESAANVAFLLVLCNYAVFRHFTYGLETGVSLILVAWCVRATLPDAGRIRPVLFGALAGLAILARIDFAVVLAVILILAIVSRRLTVAGACVAGAMATLVCAPWFLWVHHVSDHWFPSSGRSQILLLDGAHVAPRLMVMANALGQPLSPWLYVELPKAALLRVATGAWQPVVTWGVALIAAAVALAVAGRLTRAARTRAWEAGWMWAAAFGVLGASYVVFFNSEHFFARYMAPVSVLTIPVLAWALAGVAVRPAGRLLIVMLPALFVVTAAVTMHTGRIGNVHALTAGFIERDLPPGARIGAFQSGVIGYFNETVINLDGKVNAASLGMAGGGREAYIDRADIQYLVEWRGILLGGLDGAWLMAQWAPCPVQVPGGITVCLVRRSR